jgi:predicted nucleotidyltransferase
LRTNYYKNKFYSYLKARDHISNPHKTAGKIIVWDQRNLSGRKYLRSTYALFTANHLHSIQRKGDLTKLKATLIDVIILPSSATNKMQSYTIFFIGVNALCVSGGFSAHHQELKPYIQHLV